jgi:hypothetical protein
VSREIGLENDMEDDKPATHLSAEPQEERGAMGSRDTGSDEPAGGPADRPSGTSSSEDDTKVDPQGAQTSGPTLPAGDQAG